MFVVDRRGELAPMQTKLVAQNALNSLLQMKKQKLMRDLQDITVPEKKKKPTSEPERGAAPA